MRALDKNLTIVSETEKAALYGLPDFDDFQRAEYFALTAEELAVAQQWEGLSGKIACVWQIGYCKAKQAFFQFQLAQIPAEDIDFLMRRYFPGEAFRPRPVRKEEYYAQRKEILRLFGYRFWSRTFLPRLPAVIGKALDPSAKAAMKQLLVREETLSELAGVKQDAKNFGCRMMSREREKRTALAPLSGGERRRAHAGRLATECPLLRQLGHLLHNLRSAPSEAGTNSPILVVFRLAALPRIHRQLGRRIRLSHEADRGRN